MEIHEQTMALHDGKTKAHWKVALSSELKAVWWWASHYPCTQTSGKYETGSGFVASTEGTGGHPGISMVSGTVLVLCSPNNGFSK